MVMRRDGRTYDILWESHLLVAEGVDQVLECVVGGRSHNKSLCFVHTAICKKSKSIFYALGTSYLYSFA